MCLKAHTIMASIIKHSRRISLLADEERPVIAGVKWDESLEPSGEGEAMVARPFPNQAA